MLFEKWVGSQVKCYLRKECDHPSYSSLFPISLTRLISFKIPQSVMIILALSFYVYCILPPPTPLSDCYLKEGRDRVCLIHAYLQY